MRPPREKLGRLVVRPPRSAAEADTAAELRFKRTDHRWWWIGFIAMLSAGVFLGFHTGWLPAQCRPQKVILRGCELSQPNEVSTPLAAQSGDDYLHWWMAARRFKPDGQRWLLSVHPRLLAGRGLLLDITERKPVLRVESAKAGYWLCDDSTVEKARIEDHQSELFGQIKQSPVVRLDGVSLDSVATWAPEVLKAAAIANEVIAGQIKTIALNAKGELTLFDRSGLEIRLGRPLNLETKIAALPKALRTMQNDRAKLAFLDGTAKVEGDKFLFYEVLGSGAN